MATASDLLDIYFYDPSGTPRGLSPDLVADGVSWTYSDRGGMMQATIPLVAAFERGSLPVEDGDSVVIYLHGEQQPRWIGYVAVPDRTLGEAETTSLTCYGEAERMNHARITRTLIRPSGADLASFAHELLDYYQEKHPDLNFFRDIATTGISLDILTLDDGTVRGAFDTLVDQAPGLVVWGWEMDGGDLTFVLRSRQSGLVSYTETVGDGVTVLQDTTDAQKIINRANPLRGGTLEHPNVLGAVIQSNGKPNTSFERPLIAGGDGSGGDSETATALNLLTNSGFEDTDLGQQARDWTNTGGIAGPPTDGSAHGGSKVATAPNGFNVSQTISPVAATVIRIGSSYTAGVWARTYDINGGDCSLTIRLAWLDAAGVQIGAEDVQTFVITGDNEWIRYSLQSTAAPAGSAGYRIRFEASGIGPGLHLDDAHLYTKQAYQPGWTAVASGTAELRELDWVYAGIAKHGHYSVLLGGLSSDSDGNDIALEMAPGLKAPVLPGRFYSIGVWKRSPIGATATPAHIVRYEWLDGQGNGVGSGEIRDAGGATPQMFWNFLGSSVQAPSDAASVRISVRLRGTGALLVDCALVRRSAAGAGFLFETWVEGSVFERVVDAQDVTGLLSPASRSQEERGIFEDLVTNESITVWDANAIAHMQSFFDLNAVPARRPRVESGEESDNARRVSPLALGAMQILGLGETLRDYVSDVTMTASGGGITGNYQLGEPEPSIAARFASRGKAAAASSGGGGGTSTSGGGSGPGGGGGTPGGTVPLATSLITGTVKTDVTQADPVVVTLATYAANKVSTDATTATATATASEVIAARTRELVSVALPQQVFGSLKLHYAAIWAWINTLLGRTADPASAPAGSFLRTSVGGGGTVAFETITPATIGAAASSHTHPLAQITGAGTAASRDVPASGNATSTQVVLGSDTRLGGGGGGSLPSQAGNAGKILSTDGASALWKQDAAQIPVLHTRLFDTSVSSGFCYLPDRVHFGPGDFVDATIEVGTLLLVKKRTGDTGTVFISTSYPDSSCPSFEDGSTSKSFSEPYGYMIFRYSEGELDNTGGVSTCWQIVARSGISSVVALAKLTTGGANGSATYVNGQLTAYTAPS